MKTRLAGALAAAFVCCTSLAALAQTLPQIPQTTKSQAIDLGGRGLAAPEAPSAKEESEGLKFSAKAGVASNYVYRGVTLSDRNPAVGAALEAAWSHFYAWTTAASVRLPTRPDAELAFGGGIRQSFGKLDADLGVSYFTYPGAMPGSASIDYWEAAFRGETKVTEQLTWAGGFAWSPNVSNTGAWSWYAASGFSYELPKHLLPLDLGASLTAAAGYSWFGDQSPELGGFPLPAYWNWHAGVTFTHKALNLDLRYHDTNLSKEDCYVFTGDTGARPGGQRDPVTNPSGLMSNWCSAAFVVKAWIALE